MWPKQRHIVTNGRFDRAHNHVRSQANVFVKHRKGRVVLALCKDGAQRRGPIVRANLAWMPEQDLIGRRAIKLGVPLRQRKTMQAQRKAEDKKKE